MAKYDVVVFSFDHYSWGWEVRRDGKPPGDGALPDYQLERRREAVEHWKYTGAQFAQYLRGKNPHCLKASPHGARPRGRKAKVK
jgi:hypothetical protein